MMCISLMRTTTHPYVYGNRSRVCHPYSVLVPRVCIFCVCVCTEHKRAMLRGGVHLRPRWDSVRCLREDAGGVGCAHVSLRRGKEHLSLLCYDTAFIQLQVPWHHLQRKGTRHHRSQSEPSVVSRSAARKRHCLTATRPRTGIRPTVWGVKCV